MKKLREKKKSHADCQRSSCVESGLVVKNRRDIVDGLLLFLINNLGVYLRRLEFTMTKQLTHRVDVGAESKHENRESMPPQWNEICLSTRAQSSPDTQIVVSV